MDRRYLTRLLESCAPQNVHSPKRLQIFAVHDHRPYMDPYACMLGPGNVSSRKLDGATKCPVGTTPGLAIGDCSHVASGWSRGGGYWNVARERETGGATGFRGSAANSVTKRCRNSRTLSPLHPCICLPSSPANLIPALRLLYLDSHVTWVSLHSRQCHRPAQPNSPSC